MAEEKTIVLERSFEEIFKEYCSKGETGHEFYLGMSNYINSHLQNIVINDYGDIFLNASHTFNKTRNLTENEISTVYKNLSAEFKRTNLILDYHITQETPIFITTKDIRYHLDYIVENLAKEITETNSTKHYIKKVDQNKLKKECNSKYKKEPIN